MLALSPGARRAGGPGARGSDGGAGHLRLHVRGQDGAGPGRPAAAPGDAGRPGPLPAGGLATPPSAPSGMIGARPGGRRWRRPVAGWMPSGPPGAPTSPGRWRRPSRLQSPRGRLPIVVVPHRRPPHGGEQDPDRIANPAAEAARGRARVFAFGVGYDVNTRLLDAVAAARAGDHRPTCSRTRAWRAALGTLAEKIRHPVLTDLELVDTPVRIHELYPVTIPDLFAGEELVLLARVPPRGGGTSAATWCSGGCGAAGSRPSGSGPPSRWSPRGMPGCRACGRPGSWGT